MNSTHSQDIEPRRWTPLPIGTNAVGIGYANSFGDIIFDPVLKVEDAVVNINSFIASYMYSFRFLDKTARVDVVVPFNIAHWEGLLNGAPASVDRNGFTDPRIRLSLNLFGVPSGTRKEIMEYLAEHPVNTSLGVSLAVTLPLGQYFEEKLLNLGQNRFVISPQTGVVHRWATWSYEFTASAIFYTPNPNFTSGKERKQKATMALQTHLIKNFKNSYWASVSAGYGLGGQSVINRQPNADERSDVQGALSFGFTIIKTQAVKLVYIRSETLKDIGANTNTLVAAWSIIF
ncbi:MAG: transporter [Maribacter sp.]|nr:transporter [Maribacter sp.]